MVPELVTASAPDVARICAVPITAPVNTALLLSPAATRSPSTTPPVLLTSDQVVAATFATKLLNASRVIEYTVIALPEATDCAGTTVPVPSTAVSTPICVAAPATTVILLLVP